MLSRFTSIIKATNFTIGKDGFLSIVVKDNESEILNSEQLLATAPAYLDKYMFYRTLSRGIRDRVGEFL